MTENSPIIGFGQVFDEKLSCEICKSGVNADKLRWYKCVKSHTICQACKLSEDSKCPCGEMIPKIHFNLKVLKIEDLRYKCQDLFYRLVQCPRLTCQAQVPFNEFTAHVTTCE